MSVALKSLMRQMPRAVAHQRRHTGVLPFVAIGVGGALTFVVLSSALIGLPTGLADWVVNMVCYGALVLPVYLLHYRYSFASEAAHVQALPRYQMIQAMAMLLVAGFGMALHSALALPTPLASVLVICLTSVGSYLLLRGWAFVCRQRRVLLPA